MDETGPIVAGVLGATASLAGTALYLRDVRRGWTTPHRGSWLVWSVIAVVAACSQDAQGAGWSMIALWGQALTTMAVLVFAVRGGVGWLSPGNLVMLCVASAGLVGWAVFTDPLAASACAALADGIGLLATAPKAWRDPHSETAATYALAGCSGLLAAAALQTLDGGLLLFPIYYCLGNTATAGLIILRRRAVHRDAAPHPALRRDALPRPALPPTPQSRISHPEADQIGAGRP